MNSRQLQYAILLSQIRNFSQVAEHLHISQPALSKQILNLEQELGVRLFDRTTTPLSLTPAGESFIMGAKELLFREDQLLRTMEQFQEGKKGRLVIGISPFRCQYLVTDLIRRLQQRFPGIQVILREAGSAQLHKGAAEGLYDFAIVNLPVDEALLDVQLLEPEQIILAVPKSLQHLVHTEDSQTALPYPAANLSRCGELPFIVLGEQQEMRQLFDKLCMLSDIQPNICAEVVGLTTAWTLARSGVGATLLPHHFAGTIQSDDALVFYSITHSIPTRQPAIVTRKGQILSEYATAAISMLTGRDNP